MLSSNDDPQKWDLKHNLNDIKSTMNLKSYKYPFKIRLKILKRSAVIHNKNYSIFLLNFL